MSRARYQLLLRLGDLLRVNAVQSVLFHQAVADRLDLNLTDFECYGLLERHGAMPAGQLASLTGLTTGAITHAIDRLEKAGWVERRTDPSDRRRVIVAPNLERRADVVALFDSLSSAGETMIADYSDADLQLLVDYFERSEPTMQREIVKMRAAAPEDALPQEGTGAVSSARLVIASGTPRLRLRVEPTLREVYTAHFSEPLPRVRLQDGTLTLRYPRGLPGLLAFGSSPLADVTLSGRVPWELEARNGLVSLDADLRRLDLSSLDVRGGTSSGKLRLPQPRGHVQLRFSGGVNGLRVSRPVHVPLRLRVRGGATHLTLDGRGMGAVGGEAEWTSSDTWDMALDRFDLEVSGGANGLTVETEAPTPR